MFTYRRTRTDSRTHRAAGAGSQRRSAGRLTVEALEDRLLLTGDMVLRWNEALLAAMRASNLTPYAMTRAAAIVQAAVYEAVNAIEHTYAAYLVEIPALPTASEEAAAAQAAHDALVGLFPAQTGVLDLQLRASLQGIKDGEAKTEGMRVGRVAAQALLEARRDDGADRVVDYTPGSNPGDWRPTPPAFAPASGPQWPYVTPFALPSAAEYRPAPPPALDSAEYTAEFNLVKEMGSLNSATRTADQTEAALFWAGIVTPNASAAENWNQIAQRVALAQGTTLAENARVLALLNLAEADAAIACWDAKYTYNFWRPITAIREADTDGNPDTEADPNWTPLIATPAHPSYISGHSSVSSASATVLTAFFGDNVSFTYSWVGLPGVERSFASFNAAAEEVAGARLWAGIHYWMDNVTGLALGQEVGTYVLDNYLLPLGGAPAPGGFDPSGPDVVALLTGDPGERIHALAGISVQPSCPANKAALVTPGKAEADAGLRPLAARVPAPTGSDPVARMFEDFAVATWLQ